MEFGASRVVFSTSRKGGSNAGRKVTGAKCLLYFEYKDGDESQNSNSRIGIDHIANKTLCSERMEVRMLEEQNFGYQAKDSSRGCYYGTKEGYPILEFNPNDLAESRGKEKHRAGLIITRVFGLKKHRQRAEENKRETTNSFLGAETDRVIFAIHMKGSYWGKALHCHLACKKEHWMNTTRNRGTSYMMDARAYVFMITSRQYRWKPF